MFRYPHGWNDIDSTRIASKTDKEYKAECLKGRDLITQQSNQFMKSFSYWPEPDKRTGDNIYDVRSYQVKPGSMYDWGNYWAKGIKCRESAAAYPFSDCRLLSNLNLCRIFIPKAPR